MHSQQGENAQVLAAGVAAATTAVDSIRRGKLSLRTLSAEGPRPVCPDKGLRAAAKWANQDAGKDEDD